MEEEETVPEEADLFEALIDRIAEAVVRKIDERQKIDLIAEAVLARLEERGLAEGPEEAKAALRAKKPAKRRRQGEGETGDGVTG